MNNNRVGINPIKKLKVTPFMCAFDAFRIRNPNKKNSFTGKILKYFTNKLIVD